MYHVVSEWQVKRSFELNELAELEQDYVKLTSSDGFEFVVDRKCAMASGTIKGMLSSPGTLETFT